MTICQDGGFTRHFRSGRCALYCNVSHVKHRARPKLYFYHLTLLNYAGNVSLVDYYSRRLLLPLLPIFPLPHFSSSGFSKCVKSRHMSIDCHVNHGNSSQTQTITQQRRIPFFSCNYKFKKTKVSSAIIL